MIPLKTNNLLMALISFFPVRAIEQYSDYQTITANSRQNSANFRQIVAFLAFRE